MIKKARKHAVVIPTHHDRQEDRMSSKKESCLARIGQGLEQLSAIKRAYTVQQDDQDKVLLHFIERAEEIIKASLLVEALPIPLHILCRVFCEDFFLICWISQSYKAAKEYEDGVAAELGHHSEQAFPRARHPGIHGDAVPSQIEGPQNAQNEDRADRSRTGATEAL
jgi:hypothetical protein